MKLWAFIFAMILFGAIQAQEPMLSVVDSCQELIDTTPIVLQFDTIPSFTYFDANNITHHTSRIATINEVSRPQSKYFISLLFLSLIFTLLYLNSRETVISSFSSLLNIHFAIQYFRTDKQTNTFYSIIYSLLLVVCVSLLIYAVQDKLFNKDLTYLYLLVMLFVLAILDYLSSYLFLFFSKSHKSVELVQTAILSYGVVLAIIYWPSLFFILLGIESTVYVLFLAAASIFCFVYLMKEIRILQILWLEKVDILSIHFFVYLCTFKFLPLLILVKVIF